MKKLILITAGTFLALSACQNEPIGPASNDDMRDEIAAAPPVELPPSIKNSKAYRCKDNSIVYTNFLTDDLTANVRDKEEDPPTVILKASAPGEPFVGTGTAAGFKLVGTGETVTYTSPEGGTQSCST